MKYLYIIILLINHNLWAQKVIICSTNVPKDINLILHHQNNGGQGELTLLGESKSVITNNLPFTPETKLIFTFEDKGQTSIFDTTPIQAFSSSNKSDNCDYYIDFNSLKITNVNIMVNSAGSICILKLSKGSNILDEIDSDVRIFKYMHKDSKVKKIEVKYINLNKSYLAVTGVDIYSRLMKIKTGFKLQQVQQNNKAEFINPFRLTKFFLNDPIEIPLEGRLLRQLNLTWDASILKNMKKASSLQHYKMLLRTSEIQSK